MHMPERQTVLNTWFSIGVYDKSQTTILSMACVHPLPCVLVFPSKYRVSGMLLIKVDNSNSSLNRSPGSICTSNAAPSTVFLSKDAIVSTPKTVINELKSGVIGKANVDRCEDPAQRDRIGEIVRTEGPCSIELKTQHSCGRSAVHGAGQEPRVAKVSLTARTITRVPHGDITIDDRTTIYLVLLGS
jgi:hypothetical protein